MKRVTTPDQQEECAALWRAAFAVDDAWLAFFNEHVGWEAARVIDDDRAVAAALVVHDFNQTFGGRLLRCAGVALVASAPHLRSRGYARRLMMDMLREQHESGVPLSALYPSTRTLYRKVGYETAGGVFRYTVPLHRIALERAAGDVRPIRSESIEDRSLVESLYAAALPDSPGWLDRNEFLWQRVMRTRDKSPRDGYVILSGGEPDGYFFFHRERNTGGEREVQVRDVVLRSPEAGRCFLSFMADQRSVNVNLVFWGGPNDPALMLLSEDCPKVEITAYWMLRIVDVPRALAGRGYAASLHADLHLEIHGDEVIDENNGRFVLSVQDGRGEVVRGGRGELRAHIRGLAPLFSGHLSPDELALVGLLHAKTETRSDAQMIFSGRQPWMADGF